MKVYVRVFGRLQAYIVDGETCHQRALKTVVDHLESLGLVNYKPVLAVIERPA